MGDKVFKPSEKLRTIYPGGALTPPKYIPSYYEWLSTRGKFISGFQSVENSSAVVYTVPKSKVFFLTSISMNCQNEGAVASIPTVDFEVDDVPTLTVSAGKTDGASNSMALNFAIPVRLEAQRTLKIRSNRANCWVRCCYSGYELDIEDVLIF